MALCVGEIAVGSSAEGVCRGMPEAGKQGLGSWRSGAVSSVMRMKSYGARVVGGEKLGVTLFKTGLPWGITLASKLGAEPEISYLMGQQLG